MDRYKFTLTGGSPLLMSRDDVEASDEWNEYIRDPKNKNKLKAGDDRTPAWTWMIRLYHDGARLAIPSDNVMVALREAGAKIKMNRNATLKSASQSGLFIETDFLDFRFGEKAQTLGVPEIHALRKVEKFADHAQWALDHGFALFVKRAKIGQSKHVRVRARFNSWRVSGTVEVRDSAISADILGQMFYLAGRYSGLCDWRPSSKTPGRFGMFTAKVARA